MRSWLRLPEHDEAAVQALLSELLPWMESTYLRYATGWETFPPCWLWHPEIVEELLWLMDAWNAAYESEEASNKLVGDWHDRQRPGRHPPHRRLRPGCDVLAHRDEAGQDAVTVPLAADADPFVTWWATGRDDNGPAPTPEQIKAGRRVSAVPWPPYPTTPEVAMTCVSGHCHDAARSTCCRQAESGPARPCTSRTRIRRACDMLTRVRVTRTGASALGRQVELRAEPTPTGLRRRLSSPTAAAMSAGMSREPGVHVQEEANRQAS